MDKDVVRGTCMLMCPESEIEMRQREGLVHVLESRRDTTRSKGGRAIADRRKMVKMFSRSAAGKDLLQPESLRPPPVLKKTVNYLLSNVVTEDELPWSTVYSFISDRLRSVRQDMVVQQTPPSFCCAILEPIVRFHAYSSYRLCEEPVDVFDPHLNRKQLNETLKQLLVCYDSEKSEEQALSPLRDQMEALYSLLHLGTVDALDRLLFLQPPSKSQTKVALRMSLAQYHNAYVTVCRLIRHLPPLLACVTSQHLPHIRRIALSVMNNAYSSKNLRYPVSKLTALLLYANDTETVEECQYYGLAVQDSGVHFMKGTFNSSVKELQPKRLEFVNDSLTNASLPELLLVGS